MHVVVTMQVLLCVVFVAGCAVHLADLNDHSIVNWFVLPALLAGTFAVLLL